MSISEQIVAESGPTVIPLKGLRGSIARNMTLGWQAPRVAQAISVDMTSAIEMQTKLQAQAGEAVRVTLTVLVLGAVARALKAHPELNACLREEGIVRMPAVNLGMAVALPGGGLAVPVIQNADQLPLVALAQISRDLAAGSKEGKLTPRAYQGGSFTVTNLGMTGIDWFTPILNPPQVGIIGMSRMAEQAVVRDGRIVAAPMMTLTLVFDHRAVDGYPAAMFLADVKRRLESCEAV